MEDSCLPFRAVTASLVHADAGGLGAVVRAGGAAINLALTDDPLAGRDHAVATLACAFGALGHTTPQLTFSAQFSTGSTTKFSQPVDKSCERNSFFFARGARAIIPRPLKGIGGPAVGAAGLWRKRP